MKKSELKNLIKQLLKEQGPDPVEPNTGPTMFPGGIATGPAMGKPMGGGNMATPDKGIKADACDIPCDEFRNHRSNIEDIMSKPGYNAEFPLVAQEFFAKIHTFFSKFIASPCCTGTVDSNVTMTTPTTVGDKFTGGGGSMATPVKGIRPAQDAIISEIINKINRLKK